MTAAFDPYHRWLGVAPEEQPAHHYRLLGLKLYEGDADVIESAADRQMAHVRGFQSGAHADDAQKLLNEISAAKLVLLLPEEKAAYDAKLKAKVEQIKKKRKQEKKMATAAPLTAEPLATTATPDPLMGDRPAPADPLQPVIRPREANHPTAQKSGLPNIALLVGGAAIAGLLLIGGAIAMVIRPWEEPGTNVTIDDVPTPAVAPPAGGNYVPPQPYAKPVSPNNPVTPQDLPTSDPPVTEVATEPELRVPVLQYDRAKKVLLICDGSELEAAVTACDAYGLKHERGNFESPQSDEAAYHTIFTGSNVMDYWAGDRGQPEAFDYVEQFVADGGHLVVTGGFNGRNMHQMQRFGIQTGFQHGVAFRPVEEHTKVFLEGVESLVPENNRLRSAGHFTASQPHVVILDREDGGENRGPALITMPWKQGRVTFTQVEPAWQGDEWLITVLMAWIARGSPTRTSDQEWTPQVAVAAEGVDDPAPPIGREKHPMPDKEQRAAARTKIAGIFSPDDADSTAKKTALAQRMLPIARETNNDPVAQFTLLNMIRELAAEAGQATLAFEAIDLLESDFDIDVEPVRLATLGAAVKSPLAPAEKRDVINVGMTMIDAMIARDDYETAIRLVPPLLDIARRARDKEMIDALVDRRERAVGLQAAYGKAQAAIESLKTDPENAEANLAAGKFYLLVKSDWELALPLLAKGSDELLATAAQGEIAGPSESDEIEKLADAWWAAAEAADNEQLKLACLSQSGHSYRAIVDDRAGLAKVKAQKRIDEITKKLAGTTVAQRPSPTSSLKPQGPAIAVVEVVGRQEVPLTLAQGMPPEFTGAITYALAGGGEKNGVVEFTVKQAGLLFIVAGFPETAYEGNSSGGWYEERVTRRQLVENGWQELGECPWNKGRFLYRRAVAQEQYFRFRTNKYVAPQIILPRAAQVETAATDDKTEADLGFFSRPPPQLGTYSIEPKSPEASPQDNQGLIAHWTFDDGQGTVARNAVGGHDGTIKGATWTKGVRGGASSFDGNDDKVLIGNPDELNFAGPITLAAWVKSKSYPSGERLAYILTHGYTLNPSRETFLRISNERGLAFQAGTFYPNGERHSHFAKTDVQEIDTGNWVHLAGVADGQHWRLYRNGKEVGVYETAHAAVKVGDGWAIGAHPSRNERYFHGEIDDVRIYDRALLPEEVAELATP